MPGVLLSGIIAGVVATAIMTLFQLPVTGAKGGSTATLGGKLLGKDPGDGASIFVGYLIHFGYGTFWGVAFAWLIDAWLGLATIGFVTLMALALALGVALWAISQTVVPMMMRMMSDGGGSDEGPKSESEKKEQRKKQAKMSAIFLGIHLVYGAAIAAVLWFLPVDSTAPELGIWPTVVAALLLVGAIGYGMYDKRHQAAQG